MNAQAILNNLKAKKLVTVGVYGEATIGYVGAGVNVGSDLERGIDKQALNLETVLRTQLKDITENSTIDEIKEKLKQNFPKEADDAIRKEVAEHILS